MMGKTSRAKAVRVYINLYLGLIIVYNPTEFNQADLFLLLGDRLCIGLASERFYNCIITRFNIR